MERSSAGTGPGAAAPTQPDQDIRDLLLLEPLWAQPATHLPNLTGADVFASLTSEDIADVPMCGQGARSDQPGTSGGDCVKEFHELNVASVSDSDGAAEDDGEQDMVMVPSGEFFD